MFVDSEFCIRLSATLLHSLWQGVLIAIIALIAGRLMRHKPARLRYGVFVLALGISAILPALTFVLLKPNTAAPAPTLAANLDTAVTSALASDFVPEIRPLSPTQPQISPATTTAALVSRTEFNLRHCAPYLVLVYAAGVLLMIAHLLFALRGGVRLRQKSQIINDPNLIDSLARAARAIGFKVMPVLAWCERVGAPTVVGIIRPAILIPLSLANGLSTEQVELLLMHELAHLRRHDHWVNLAQRLVEALYFFNPAVWLISRRIRIERELACDDMVLSAGVKQAAYADSLLRMAELSRERTASILALGATGSPLARRILRIIGRPAHEEVRMNRVWPVVFIAILLAAGVYIGRAWGGETQSFEIIINTDDGGRGNEKEKNANEKEKEIKTRMALRDRATTGTLTWGKEVNGLRAALELTPNKTEYADGERIKVRFHIRNVSRHPIQLASSEVRTDDRAIIRDSNGEQVATTQNRYTGRSNTVRRTLRPGETTAFDAIPVGIGKAGNYKPGGPVVGNVLDAPSGRYYVSFSLKFPDIRMTSTRDPKENIPQPGDWQGTLITGEVPIKIKTYPRVDRPNKPGERLTFHGIDLTSAPLAKTSQVSADMKSKDVVYPYFSIAGTIIYIPSKSVYYVQYNPFGASDYTYYGPFHDDPTAVMDGVQITLRADQDQWPSGGEPTFKIDLHTARKRALPGYGPPLDDYMLDMDGVTYVRSETGRHAEKMRSMIPPPHTDAEDIYFRLRPSDWCRDDGTSMPMPALKPGKNRIRVRLPLDQHSSAISNQVVIGIAPPPEPPSPDSVTSSAPTSARRRELAEWFDRFKAGIGAFDQQTSLTQSRLYGIPRDDLAWSDIPILLELAEDSTLLKKGIPSSVYSSYYQTEGRAGTIMLWTIEQLRVRDTNQRFPALLNPVCIKGDQEFIECQSSEPIHQEALAAYQKWWARVQSLPPAEAAKIDPLESTDLYWVGRKSVKSAPPTTPTLSWGKEVNGLRAAVEVLSDKKTYASGETMPMRFRLQNVSDRDIQMVGPDEIYKWSAEVRDEHGTKIANTIKAVIMTDLSRRRVLKPGETVVYQTKSLMIGNTNRTADRFYPSMLNNILNAPSGKYSIIFGLQFNAEGGWKGRVNTGQIDVTIGADTGSNKPAKKEKLAAELLDGFEHFQYEWQQGEAAKGLVALGDKSVLPRIEPYLHAKTSMSRSNAGFVLAGLGDDRGFDAIIKELEDKSPRATDRIRSDGKPDVAGQIRQDRYYAALLLGNLRNKKAIPALTEALKDPDIALQADIALKKIDSSGVAWGKEINGLRFGLALDPAKKEYDPDEVVTARCYLENVSGKLLKVVPPSREPVIKDFGKELKPRQFYGMILDPLSNMFPAGEIMAIVGGKIIFGSKDDPQARILDLAPGKHVISFSNQFDFADTLETGNVEVTIAAVPTVKTIPARLQSGGSMSGPINQVIDPDLFHGVDLKGVPRTTRTDELPDLWEEVPPGSHSHEMRKEVFRCFSAMDGSVYYVPSKKVFYIQHAALGSSQMTFYGPLQGESGIKPKSVHDN